MKRGLFRLWVLISVCWLLVVGTVGISAVVSEMCILGPKGGPCPIFERYVDPNSTDPYGVFNADPGNTGIDLPGHWHLIFHDATMLFWLGVTFLPVAALLVFGRGVLWVIDGFRG